MASKEWKILVLVSECRRSPLTLLSLAKETFDMYNKIMCTLYSNNRAIASLYSINAVWDIPK